MVTKIKATVYAARLRKKLAELKKARPKQIEAYHAGVAKWRKDLTKFVLTQMNDRIAALKPKKSSTRWGSDRRFEAEDFFHGAPNPPEWPSDDQIRAIQNMLRHLGITGQETVQVSTDDVTKLLGEQGDAED